MKKTGIENLREREISSLSGGQKQKVAIASIIALRPKILVLDEPTGELDPVASRNIFSILRELNEDYGMTIIVIEQKIMLLGGIHYLLPVIKAAYEQGYYVITADYLPDNIISDGAVCTAS